MLSLKSWFVILPLLAALPACERESISNVFTMTLKNGEHLTVYRYVKGTCPLVGLKVEASGKTDYYYSGNLTGSNHAA
jgi:hypothetical protein